MKQETDEMPIIQAKKIPLLLHVAKSFRLRCLIDAESDILNAGVTSRDELNRILHVIFQEEYNKARLLEELEKGGSEIEVRDFINRASIKDLPAIKILSGLYQLYLEGNLDARVERDSLIFRLKIPDVDVIRTIYRPIKVIDDGVACSGCGICQSTCPVGCITIDDGKPVVDLDACIRCGLCYVACPRSFLPKKVLEWADKQEFFDNTELKVGRYLEAWSATATRSDITRVRQDGGVVSAVLITAFENELIDAAVGVGVDPTAPWKPVPFVMHDAGDVIRAAGTKYVNAPSLSLLRGLAEKERIAIVGTPCMMQALKKAELYPTGTFDIKKVVLKIGIFCMESFSYESIKALAERIFNVGLNEVTKMNIDKGKFFVHLKDGSSKSVSMQEASKFARPACHCCYDLTSEQADLSVGSIGSPNGWNTVLIRTERGKRFFDLAVNNEMIEKQELNDEMPSLKLLKKISFRKKRNFEKIEAKRAQEHEFSPKYDMILPPKPRKNKKNK
ncbi:MAG: Coenzyme F420 hydrogenase/dehydrogenase, beta subunit C-terminal domain [Promethearchaeota archaeon]